MESIEYCIKELQEDIISFNEFWEDPITDSELIKNPWETADLIQAYCNLLNVKLKKKNKFGYETFSKEVQDIIKSIINLVTDGRDLRNKVKYINCKKCFSYDPVVREFDHHVQDNGYLRFENDPLEKTKDIIYYCDKLKEAVDSTNKVNDLTKFEGKYLEYEYYEDGSFVIKIDKIYCTKENKYTFDGKIVEFTTVNQEPYRDGVLISELNDYPFEKLLFAEIENSPEGIIEYLESGKEVTYKDIYESVERCIKCFMEEYIR